MSTALITLALKTLACSQKELAKRVGVSPTQISKWKNGEYMSADMQDVLGKLTGIGGRTPEFVCMAGSLEDAIKWEKLLCFLAQISAEGAETGYHTDRLEEESEAELLHAHTFSVLAEMGVKIPRPFPLELDFDYEGPDLSEDEAVASIDHLFEHPYVRIISDIYKSYTNVYGFFSAYVSNLLDELDVYGSEAENIEPELLALAAAKLDEVPSLAKNFQTFRRQTLRNYSAWLKLLKEKAFQAGLPLRAELMDLVYESHDAVGQEAEAESLGFNDSRLHPDIYMNELLVGMRTIHQVLPAILKKLGIDQEFQLDTSEILLGGGNPDPDCHD